ncbi:hypothetical protein [Nocardia sp. NPDC004123]
MSAQKSWHSDVDVATVLAVRQCEIVRSFRAQTVITQPELIDGLVDTAVRFGPDGAESLNHLLSDDQSFTEVSSFT